MGSQKGCGCKTGCPKGNEAVGNRSFLQIRIFLIEYSSFYVLMINVMEVKAGNAER